jgi:twitching motility protein PilT
MPIFLSLTKTFPGHQRDVNTVAFSQDEKILASGGGDRKVRLWSLEDQEPGHVLDHGEVVNGVAFAPAGPVLASAGRDGCVKLWNTETGLQLGSIQSHASNATALVFSPNGTRLISASQEGRIKIFNLREKKIEADVVAHAGWIWHVAMSSQGDLLLSAGADHVARIWRLGTKDQPITLSGHQGEVLYASFSPDGRFVATAGKDGTVKFWEAGSGRLLHSFKAHEGDVNCVNFSPDGIYLASAGADRFARIWLAQNGELISETEGGYDYMSEFVFSRSGRRMASCGGDGMVKVWEVSDKPSVVAAVEFEQARVPEVPFTPEEVKRDPLLDIAPLARHTGGDVAADEIQRDPLLDTGPLAAPNGGYGGPRLNRLLSRAVRQSASDIHVPSGVPVMFRTHGKLAYVDGEDLFTPQQTESMLMEVLTDEQRRIFTETNDLDFSYQILGSGRFRANLCRQHRGVDGTFRVIPDRIPSPFELGLPTSVPPLTKNHQGLVLITGPAGQGKSTTIAALVDTINNEKPLHIITVEDPIEFVYPIRMAVVNQREVGKHTLSFANALRAALREDPDVIVVGEMRDLETISLAITAAETGHLVFASLMTTNASQTIDRILDSFPSGQQAQIRTMLSESLRGIVSQQLVPSADGSGRVLAAEVLISSLAVANMIRERKTHQLSSVMQTGRNVGMQRMDDALADLWQANLITSQSAILYSHDPKAMEMRVRQPVSGTGTASTGAVAKK